MVEPWMGKALSRFSGVALGLVLGACSAVTTPERAQWEIYQNDRYDFAFPYPDTWVPGPVMDNLDGREFRDPHLETVSIRGWASQMSGPRAVSPAQIPDHEILPNFTTEQGVEGRLQVTIGADVSLLQLMLTQGGVVYYWEGRSPSEVFDDYFKFFFYVAKQYEISAPPESP